MKSFLLMLAAAAVCAPAGHAAPEIEIHGKTWAEGGQIVNSTDTLTGVRADGNRLQGMGAQFTALATFNEHLQAAIGFGGMQVFHSPGNEKIEGNGLSVFRNYITEARLTYSLGEPQDPYLSFTAGNFIYDYNPHVRNLGLYLLRGPVYPGFLMGGFGNVHTDDSRANLVGARANSTLNTPLGTFEQDLILSQEREVAPGLDWSLAYLAKYKKGDFLELGGGVNFYRLFPVNSQVTTLSRERYPTMYVNDSITLSGPHHPYDLRYIEVMPSGDTVFYTHQGIKLMAMFSLDLKALLANPGKLGPNDLELYGEAAVIGVKDYGSVYDNILERIPVMLGFNVPTFGLLDLFAVEVEWYGAKYRADYAKLGIFNALYNRGINPGPSSVPIPSPIPTSYKDYGISPEGYLEDSTNVRGTDFDVQNMTSDDWKWSVYLEKTVQRHVRFTAQVANDHYVPRPARGNSVSEAGGTTEAFTTLKDWYFMFRVGYFF